MGIKFFRKNKIDLDFSVSMVVTDAVATNNGQDFVDYLRNRNNTSGWGTTGSTDAALTQIDIVMPSRKDVDSIILIEMNFKAYTIQYYDVNTSMWSDFSTPITVTDNTEKTKLHTFDKVSASTFRLIVQNTFVVDSDKLMNQLIITESLGEFSFQPKIKPTIDKGRKATKYLSGKSHIIKNAAAFQCDIEQPGQVKEVDLALVETLFDSYEGFLIWLCGGTVTQYDTIRQGYRLQDVFLVNVDNEYKPEWGDSRYKNGMKVDLSIVEVI